MWRADSRRPAGRALERATDDFRDHDCMGIADGAGRTGAHPKAALFCAFRIRRCGGRFFPRRDRLSEPLVQARGPREGDEQLHGGNSNVVRHRLANRGLDSRPQMVRRRRLALAVRPGGNAGHPVRRGCVFPSDRLAWRSDLARSRATAMDLHKNCMQKSISAHKRSQWPKRSSLA